MYVHTVGELRKFLEKYPDDKPLILSVEWTDDDNEDIVETSGVTIDDWADGEAADDLDWPVAIFVRDGI